IRQVEARARGRRLASDARRVLDQAEAFAVAELLAQRLEHAAQIHDARALRDLLKARHVLREKARDDLDRDRLDAAHVDRDALVAGLNRLRDALQERAGAA